MLKANRLMSCIAAGLLLFTTSAWAEDDINTNFKAWGQYIVQLLKKKNENEAILNYKPSLDPQRNESIEKKQSTSIAANVEQKTSKAQTIQEAQNKNSSVIKELKAAEFNIDEYKKNLYNKTQIQKNFDINSLFSNQLAYKSDEERQQALNYITFATGQIDPIVTLPKSALDPSRVAVRNYELKRHAYYAVLSAALDYLYKIYAEQVPQKDLGTHSGVFQGDASPAQVDKFLAEKRSSESQWYEDMAAASPATIQRETLYVLAEIRQELYKLRQEYKQSQAIMTVVAINQLQSKTKDELKQLYPAAANIR